MNSDGNESDDDDYSRQDLLAQENWTTGQTDTSAYLNLLFSLFNISVCTKVI